MTCSSSHELQNYQCNTLTELLWENISVKNYQKKKNKKNAKKWKVKRGILYQIQDVIILLMMSLFFHHFPVYIFGINVRMYLFTLSHQQSWCLNLSSWSCRCITNIHKMTVEARLGYISCIRHLCEWTHEHVDVTNE